MDDFLMTASSLLSRLEAAEGELFCRWVETPAQPGVIAVAYPIYQPIEDEFWALIDASCSQEFYARWGDWLKSVGGVPSVDWVRSASAENVLLTAISLRRAERFGDGKIASAHENGYLAAIVQRLIELRAQLPFNVQTSRWFAAS